MKTLMKSLTLLAFVAVFGTLLGTMFGESSQAVVRKRSEIPFSFTARYAGSVNGAMYVIDSQVLRQYDVSGRVRLEFDTDNSKGYWFSPSGFHYLVSGLSDAEFTSLEDTSGVIAGSGDSGYALYNVMGQLLHRGRAPKSAEFYLSSTGRYLVANSAVGAGVEITVFDSLGTQIGLCHVSACDTVIFAPHEQGFMVAAGSKGLFQFYFSGEKIASYPSADCFNYSLTGKRVVTFSNGVANLYEREKLLSTHKVSRPSAIKVIYEDSRGRLFVLTKKYLFKINTLTKVTMMEYGTIGEGRVFEDVAYSKKSDMLALTISVSRGSTVSKDKQSAGYALRVITADGDEQPFYYVMTNKTRRGYPRVQLKATGKGALFLTPAQVHNVDW